jgi:3-hydroxyisobutyrate dehydrogenase
MKIGLMGTGLIGTPMSKRLIENDFELVVYNRTKAKTESLKKMGAGVAENPQDLLRDSEFVILTLLDAKAITDVLFSQGCEEEISGKTIIQMGTILPSESIGFNEKIGHLGGEYFEAPVLGSIPETTAGKLIVMVGSTNEQFEKWNKFLKIFGPNPVHAGSVGKAAALKLSLNHLIASLTCTFSLSLGMIKRSGINVDLFMNILRESALYAPTFDKKLKRMLERDFTRPNFPVRHLLKDVNLVREMTENLELSTSGIEYIIEILKNTMNRGLADRDYSALYEAVNPPDN